MKKRKLILFAVTGGLGFLLYTWGLSLVISIRLQMASWFFILLTGFTIAVMGLAIKYYYRGYLKL